PGDVVSQPQDRLRGRGRRGGLEVEEGKRSRRARARREGVSRDIGGVIRREKKRKGKRSIPDLKPHAGFRLPVCLHTQKLRCGASRLLELISQKGSRASSTKCCEKIYGNRTRQGSSDHQWAGAGCWVSVQCL